MFTRNDPVNITQDLQNKFKDFQNIFNTTNMTPEAVAEQVRGVDQSIINCAKSTKNGALTWDMYIQSLNSMTLGARIGQVALKGLSIVCNTALMLAVSAAVSKVISAWDTANVTVEEVQEKINGINSSLQSLNAELDKLSGKNNLTEAEQDRLEYLQDRIDLEERLLRVEQARLVREKLGDPDKVTDWFDDDSYVKKASREFGEEGVNRIFSFLFAGNLLPSVLSDLNNIYAHFNGAESVLDNAGIQYQEISMLDQNYKNAVRERNASAPESEAWNYWDKLAGDILKNIDSYAKSFQSTSYGDLLEKYSQYTLEAESLQSILDNPEYLSAREIDAARHYLKIYSTKADEMKDMINSFAVTLKDPSLWIGTDLELLSAKTDRLTPDTIQRFFDDQEIKILASLDFDRNAGIGTLQALLRQQQTPLSLPVTPAFSLTEEQSRLIDEFQSRINSLSDALSAEENNTLSPSATLDLVQQFPQLAGETDNLREAAAGLAQTLLDDLLSALGKEIPQDLRNTLKETADEVGRTATQIQTLSPLLSGIQSTDSLQSALRQEISSGAVSAATLQRIIDQYPLMEDAVNAYCAGLLTEAGLYDLLSRQYAQDLDVFQETGRAKLYTSELFYSQCLDDNSDLVSQLAEEYGLDLRNFKNVQAAKLAGEQKLLGSMAGLWSQYYEVVLDKDGQYKIQGTPYSETYDVQNSSEYIAMEEESQKIQEYLDKLNKIFRLYSINSLEFSPGTMDSSPDSPDQTAADTEPFSEKRDWIEKLISATSSALDRLKDKISNTYLSWTLRNHSLTQSMQKTKEAIAAQQQACESYMREAAAVGLPREYIDKIQSGTLQLETITDQALADRIREYETWHDKAARCSEAVEDLKNQLSELARQRFDNINTYFQGLIATTEKTIARLNARQNNTFKADDPSLYRKLRAQTQTLLDYNTQRAARLEEALDDAAGGGYLEAGSQAWRDMYNEILEVQNATEEYKNQLNELAQKEYDALLRPFENALTRLEQRKSLIDAMTLRLELQGHTASRGLYERQLREDQASLRSLTEQAEQLRRNMSDAAGKGMETGSDQWLEMRAALAENTSAAMELENNIQKLKNSIRELDWEKFDRLKDSLTPLDDEADFLLDLLDQDGLYDEDGSLNENGNAAAGLHTRNYYTQLELAGRYRTELDRITAELADDPYNTTLEQRQYELADACRAAARAASEEYRAVTDLARKGYQAQADALRKLTDARKELLDTEKSQYQYQKNLAEKTRNLSGIQKQLSALSGDDSEENKARIQKLSTDLEEARRDLEETTYDKWYSDQAELLDRLAEEYEELITRQTQEEQTLFQEMTASADANARQIQDTINAAARKWGYRPSDDLLSAWTTGQDGSADIAANTALQLRRLCELNEKLYRAAAALGDLGLTDYGLETTLTDETAARNFIGRLYQGLLHRQPDEAGMDFWLHRLTDGATVQDILEGFLGSPEYLALNKSPSDTILDFYQGLLGRQAEDAGYQHWMEQYHSGMTLGEIGTHGFLDSPEFLSDKMWLRLADAVPLIPAFQSLPPVSPPNMTNTLRTAPTFGDLNITIEHVNDYNDFVTQLQKDNKFERMVQDMTLGRALGQAGLAKNSYRF